MGWDRKIFPLWILFAGSLIGSCVAQSYLQPNIATTYDATTYGYIQSSCYDSTRKIAFIGTTAINGQKSHVIPFNVSTQSFGTPVPTEEPSSLDVCVFDPVQNYVYYVTGATQSDSEITIIRVNVATTTPGSSDVSYAVLYANPAQLDLINFGVFIDTDLVAFVGKGMTRIPMAQLIFNPTIDNTNATENTEAVTLFWDPTVGTFISGFTDGPIGYFVSTQNPARMYSVNLTADGDPGIDKNNLTIVGSGVFTIGPIQDCVYDSGRRLAYCWNSVPGQRSQMDVVSLNQTGVVQLGPNSKETTVAVMDTQHGQLYVGGGATTANQGFVSQVSLKTLTLNPAVDTDVQLLGGQKYLKIGWLVDDQTLNIGYGYSYVNNSGSNLASAGVFSAELPAVCPGTPECSGKGECVYATCVCNNLNSSDQAQYPDSTAYAGDKCDTVNCKYDCTNNVTGFVGTCNAGTCLCGANYTGDFCETQQCPYNCSQRGFCNETAAYTCECNPGWSGAGCEDQIPVTCSSHKNCKDCLSDTSCGWCRSEGKCTEGDLNGPFESGESGCTSWYFTQCPEVGMEFFGYLFTILAGIMILINIVSLVQEEANPLIVNKTSDLDIRETWWRNQRSVKTWLMVDEIQFAAITAMFAVKSPSLYFNFVTIFRWSVIGFPLPWSQRDFDTGRDTLSMDQYSSSILSKDTEVFFGSLFWLAMLIGFTVLVFLVLRVFGRICFASDYGIRNFFKNRLVYTLVRIAMFIYFPFAVFTTYSFTVDSAGAIVISIIFLLLVHIPLAIFLWRIQPKSKKDSTKLFRPEFLNRYGCLYHSFYVKRAWFQEVVFLRKLAMGAIVGLLQGSETAQLIILMIIQASYLIAVLVLQPFLDSMHMFIEISSSIGHLIMIALMFPFIGSLNLDMTDDVAIFLSVAIAAISLILQLICIGGFINNWMKMNNIASFMDLVDRCRGGSGSGKAIDVELDLTRSKQK